MACLNTLKFAVFVVDVVPTRVSMEVIVTSKLVYNQFTGFTTYLQRGEIIH